MTQPGAWQQPPAPPPGGWPPPPMPPQGGGQPQTPAHRGFSFGDFINFRYMITPGLITIIYVLAVIGITLGALAAINTSAVAAVLIWVFGMLWVRVIFETMIVLFRINDGIQEIARRR
jgi:Domain of unknown function (DUF4282)